MDTELESQLPTAKLFKIRFSVYWCKRFLEWALRKRNVFGFRIPFPKFYLTMRGANFQTYYLGPINITVRKRWLLLSAKTLYPKLFKEWQETE